MLFTAPISKCKFIYCRSLLRENSAQKSEIRIANVRKSNSNFKIEVRKFELRLTSLLPTFLQVVSDHSENVPETLHVHIFTN